MKNLFILFLCLSLFAGACSKSDNEAKPDYSAVKQQLPLKLKTWVGFINTKSFSAAKLISIEDGDFWDRAEDAELLIEENKQITYFCIDVQLDENSFLPERGSAVLKGEIEMTRGPLKSIESYDFEATLYCAKDPILIENWKLKNLTLK